MTIMPIPIDNSFRNIPLNPFGNESLASRYYPPLLMEMLINYSRHRWYTSGGDFILVVESFKKVSSLILCLKPILDKFHGKIICSRHVYNPGGVDNHYLAVNFKDADPGNLLFQLKEVDIPFIMDMSATSRVHPSCDECIYRLENLNGDCSLVDIPFSDHVKTFCRVPQYRSESTFLDLQLKNLVHNQPNIRS